MPRWSRGLGRWVFTPEDRGSNPLRGTNLGGGGLFGFLSRFRKKKSPPFRKFHYPPRLEHARENWFPVEIKNIHGFVNPDFSRSKSDPHAYVGGEVLAWVDKNLQFEDYIIERKQVGFFNVPHIIWFKNKKDIFTLIFVVPNENNKAYMPILDEEELRTYRKRDQNA